MIARLLILLFSLNLQIQAAPLDVRLPTENRHLFTGEMDQFYMYVVRNLNGQVTHPWQGGTYGFVRNAARIKDQDLFVHFHEGIDIAPVSRDAVGNPLDLVSSIAAGRVAYVSLIAKNSNYGKYVVIEHDWENSRVLSLYAHLSEITCKPGDAVSPGSFIGHMGFTGAGIDRARAHCHVELGMLMSTHYGELPSKYAGAPNIHGIYNGMNLIGADVAKFFLDLKANPALQFSQFIASTPVYFKVAVPAHGTPDFVTRYPWIARGNADATTLSWEISLSATGLPVTFTPSPHPCSAPLVIAVRPSTVPHRYLTRNLITGEGDQATLTRSGLNLIALLTDELPAQLIPKLPAARPAAATAKPEISPDSTE